MYNSQAIYLVSYKLPAPTHFNSLIEVRSQLPAYLFAKYTKLDKALWEDANRTFCSFSLLMQ